MLALRHLCVGELSMTFPAQNSVRVGGACHFTTAGADG